MKRNYYLVYRKRMLGCPREARRMEIAARRRKKEREKEGRKDITRYERWTIKLLKRWHSSSFCRKYQTDCLPFGLPYPYRLLDAHIRWKHFDVNKRSRHIYAVSGPPASIRAGKLIYPARLETGVFHSVVAHFFYKPNLPLFVSWLITRY